MQNHIWRDDFVFQFRVLARVSRVLVAAHVPPRPAVETAFLNVSDVVRNEIVSQRVPLVHRTPQLAGLRVDRQAYTIADAGRVNSHRRTVGIELQNIGTILFRRGSIGVVNIRHRAHRNEHMLAVGGELYVARPMSAAPGDIGNMFRRTARFQIPILIRKAHNRICVPNVDPLRVRSWRIKIDSEGTIQTGGIDPRLLRLTLGCNSAKYLDFSSAALRHEKIAIGGRSNQTWLTKPTRIKLDFKSRWHERPRFLRARHQLGAVARRRRSEWGRQIL